MNYVSIGLETLSTAAFLGSPEDIVGAWVKLVRFCAQSENGGRIIGAKAWNERLWLITCALPLGILNRKSPLWTWDKNDLVVEHYPTWSEEKAKRCRAGASKTNSKRWGDKRVAERHGKRVAGANHTASQHRSFVHNVHNVLKGTNKNAAAPSESDLKTQWAATRAEIKRLEELESEQDGALTSADALELSRLRKQLRDITKRQTGGKA